MAPHRAAMKVPALALSLTVGASLIGATAPVRAGVISNLLGTAAETVQPGSGGVVRSGWGLLRGVGRAVIPRRRRRPAPPSTASTQPPPPRKVPSAAPPPEDTEAVAGHRQVLAESPPQAGAGHEELTVEDLLVAPPPPPAAAVPSRLVGGP